MNNMIWLIRREVWENRSLWIAPLVVAGIILVIAAFGGVHVGNGNDVSLGWDSGSGAHMSDAGSRKHPQRHGDGAVEQEADHLRDHLVHVHRRAAVHDDHRAVLLSTGFAARRAQGPQHPVLEVAAGFGRARWCSRNCSPPPWSRPVFVLLVSSALQVLFAGVWSMRFSGSVLGDALMAWDGATWLKIQASFLLLLASGHPLVPADH